MRMAYAMFVGTLLLFAQAQVTVQSTTTTNAPVKDSTNTTQTNSTIITEAPGLTSTNSTFLSIQQDGSTATNPTNVDKASSTTGQNIIIVTTTESIISDFSTTNGSSDTKQTTSSTATTTTTTTEKNGVENDPTFASKIVGVMLGLAVFLALVVVGGTALQKHMRRKALKKAETPNPPPEFNNPVNFNADTSV